MIAPDTLRMRNWPRRRVAAARRPGGVVIGYADKSGVFTRSGCFRAM